MMHRHAEFISASFYSVIPDEVESDSTEIRNPSGWIPGPDFARLRRARQARAIGSESLRLVEMTQSVSSG